MKISALVILAASFAIGGPAVAQESLKTPEIATGAPRVKAKKQAEKPAAGPRRPGELEGWSRADSKASAKAAASERRGPSEDGGLPLPRARSTTTEPGVGFDRSGNFTTGVKF